MAWVGGMFGDRVKYKGTEEQLPRVQALLDELGVTRLYKTRKGAYFITSSDDDRNYLRAIDEDTAKYHLMHHNYKKYAEMFGELEEA